MTTIFDLSPATVEAVARRVAELLVADDWDARSRWVDAAEVARRFGISRDTVYAKATDLGAIRLGDGPRARLRFDPQLVAERLGAEEPPTPAPAARPRTPGPKPSTVELLPIRGRPRTSRGTEAPPRRPVSPAGDERVAPHGASEPPQAPPRSHVPARDRGGVGPSTDRSNR